LLKTFDDGRSSAKFAALSTGINAHTPERALKVAFANEVDRGTKATASPSRAVSFKEIRLSVGRRLRRRR
jgi:hypothetical protein